VLAGFHDSKIEKEDPSPLSKILGWIADPVEPFGFERVQGEPTPLLLDGRRGKLKEPPSPFDEANDRLENGFEDMHNRLVWIESFSTLSFGQLYRRRGGRCLPAPRRVW
jgi:hypothetical protein